MNFWWHILTAYQYRNSSVKPLKYLNFLKKSQWWDRERLERYRLEKLRALIRYAKDHTDYYNEKFAGLDIDTLTLSDLQQLPVLSKGIVQEKAKDLMLKDKGIPFVEASTSGSTGIPLKIYRAKDASAILMAGHYRFHSWWGVRPGDRHIIIWGSRQTKEKERNFIKRLKDKLIPPALVIDVFDLNEDTIQDYVKRVIEYRPKYIRGYVSSIKQFFQLVKDRGIDVSPLKLKVIITTSEVLYPHDRAFIEIVSGCPVANEYGSRDGGQFAYECPDGGMHIQEEYQYLWTTKDNELIGTELNNYAMPLINYCVGDRVVFSDKPCTCGRSLKTLEKIEGRIGDMVMKPDGSFISHWIFYYIVKELDDIGYGNSIKQFKVIQKATHFDFYIVKDRNYRKQVTSYIKKRMVEIMGHQIDVFFHFPARLEREKSGKLRYFVRLS